MRFPVTFLFFICLLFNLELNAKTKTLKYPRPAPDVEERAHYHVELLNLIVSKAKLDYELVPSEEIYSQLRAIYMLSHGETPPIDIMWSMTSNEREALVDPIRIPIHKGLIGLRLPLVHSPHLQDLSITTKKDLDKYEIGQGHDWPDTLILKENGLKVYTAVHFDALFKMLALDRFDFFFRSIVEIWPEVDKYKNLDLMVGRKFAVYYPTASYFFVRKGNTKLANELTKGFNIAIKDGSFEKLFLKYHQKYLDKAQLNQRTIIKLNNPILPKQTPLEIESYWIPLNLKD
jgi:ABC-type amino acid transport substrate-binding protein